MLAKTLPLVLLLACKHAAPTSTPTEVARDPRLAVLDRMKTAIEARDASAFAALYADDAVLEESGGTPVRGRAQIEATARTMMAPAEAIRYRVARVWLNNDVAVVEAVFRAHHGIASPLYDIGESALSIYWFDANGRITKEHTYRDQPTLEGQAAGDPQAAEIPMLPDEPEIHITHAATDAATTQWVRDFETKSDTVDLDAATFTDDVVFECVPGHFHGTNRNETAEAMKHWRVAFPKQTNRESTAWRVGDYVIFEDVFQGVHEKDLGEIKASGKSVQWHWAKIVKLQGGKVSRAWQWGNFDELYRQIGAPAKNPNVKKVVPACSIHA
jgi:ketosteroid isomerase-like protein